MKKVISLLLAIVVCFGTVCCFADNGWQIDDIKLGGTKKTFQAGDTVTLVVYVTGSPKLSDKSYIRLYSPSKEKVKLSPSEINDSSIIFTHEITNETEIGTWKARECVICDTSGNSVSKVGRPTYDVVEGETGNVGGLDNFKVINTYGPNQFSDVDSSAWYYEYVKKAFELGLMNGVGNGRFNPEGNVTYAEAITIASRLHMIYYGKELGVSNGEWYTPYVDYARANEIVTWTYQHIDNSAQRCEYINILGNAFPNEGFVQISTISDNAIPDYPTAAAYGYNVYKLYKAGILTGSDSKGTFNPYSNVTRAEVATILAKMTDESMRTAVTLK